VVVERRLLVVRQPVARDLELVPDFEGNREVERRVLRYVPRRHGALACVVDFLGHHLVGELGGDGVEVLLPPRLGGVVANLGAQLDHATPSCE
jgi:hypothetical protein